MTICIAGKNSIAINICKYLILNYPSINLLGIINRTDNGLNKFEPSFKNFLNISNVKEVNLEDVYNIEDLLFISLEFDRIINTKKFKTKKIFNIHFSLLPEYKGMYTSALPILHGKEYTGVSLHEIDNGIDTGNLISQTKIPIDDDDTARTMYFKYLKTGEDLVKKSLKNLIDGKTASKMQEANKASYYSKNSIDYSNLEIKFNQTAYQVLSQIRAFTFREYQLPSAMGMKFCKGTILNSFSRVKYGTVLNENFSEIIVSTIDYDIKLYKDFLPEFIDACKSGNYYLVEKLYPFILDINEKDVNGWSALMVAIYNHHIDIVYFLLKNNARIDIVSNNGTTCLMYAKDAALKNNDYTIIDKLLYIENNIYVKDYYLKSVLDYVETQDIKLYNYLFSKQ
jgi:methionyl-tRNA formyltransferase